MNNATIVNRDSNVDDVVSQIVGRAQNRASSQLTPGQLRDRARVSDLVVGIDFGTTYTGVAYAHSLTGTRSNLGNPSRSQAKLDEIADKVIVVKQWPGSELFEDKTPTIIAYRDGRISAWGGRAKNLDTASKIKYFKLGLQEGAGAHYSANTTDHSSISLLGGFLDDHNWRHPELPNKSAVDYTEEFFRQLKRHVLNDVLPRHLSDELLQNEHISYAITVPAIWTDKAKNLTIQAAERAGIPTNGLFIVSEPEAAALFCVITCRGVVFQPGERFVVCDAGGGTVVPVFFINTDAGGSHFIRSS